MMHRTIGSALKWTLCRDGEGDPEPVEFDSYGKALEFLARRGDRCTGRDIDVRVIYYEPGEG